MGALALAASLIPATAQAAPSRRGLQVEGLIGGSSCIPGKADCRSDNAILDGRTETSVGGGVAIGWRAARWLMLGGMYRGGAMNPQYELASENAYDWGAQHSVFGVIRPILPIWRFDLGLSLAPGWSRQAFRLGGDDFDYTQGFSFLVGPSVDIFVAKHVFLGVEADFIFNAHGEVCERRGNSTQCLRAQDRHLAPVHQAIYGFHLGFTIGG